MERVAGLGDAQRRELFSETAARLGMTPAVAEKDFWVTWVLARLFDVPELARVLMFKGGTSLSKAYGLIERFSEDIDLILDWRVLVGEDPRAERSRTRQQRLNEQINQQANAYVANTLFAQVQAALDGVCRCAIAHDDPFVIEVQYPAAFADDYLRPEVRLEIGPLAAWLPHEERSITCYAAEAFPRLFDDRTAFAVRVIRAERTFWEKATILHQEAHRPAGNPQPARYSRHYYDLAQMAASPVREAALADLGLLAEVVAFKQRFYPRGWAAYEQAVPGSLRLVPDGEVLAAVAADYRAMAVMIFGKIPKFDEIMARLQDLENEINGSAHVAHRPA